MAQHLRCISVVEGRLCLPACCRRMMRGVDIRMDASSFIVQLVSGLFGFRLKKETYALDGEEVTGPRRDMRAGAARGALHSTGKQPWCPWPATAVSNHAACDRQCSVRPELLHSSSQPAAAAPTRAGAARARAVRSPRGGVLVRSTWGEPHAGSAEEHFYLESAGVLRKDNVIRVGDRTAHINAVFRRE